jgi:hypothetical protein
MLIKVTRIAVIAPFKLSVRFNDGSAGTHDCATIVDRTGSMFLPLRNPAYFARVLLEFGAPTWPNGFDMCPDWLYEEMRAGGELALEAAE